MLCQFASNAAEAGALSTVNNAALDNDSWTTLTSTGIILSTIAVIIMPIPNIRPYAFQGRHVVTKALHHVVFLI